MNNFKKVFLLLFCFLVFVSKVQADIIEVKEGNVTNYINTEDRVYRMSQHLDTLSNAEKVKLLDDALANPASYEPIHYVALADVYFSSDKRKAALTYMIGLLRSTEDVAMCEDTSARAQLGIYPMFSPRTINYIQSLDKTALAKIKQEALDWDINHAQRVNPIWSCHHGMASFMGDVKIKPMSEFADMQKMIRDAFSKAF